MKAFEASEVTVDRPGSADPDSDEEGLPPTCPMREDEGDGKQRMTALHLAKRGAAKRQRGRGEEALCDCEEALRISPDCALAMRVRGMCHFDAEHWALASADFNCSQRDDYDDATASTHALANERARAAAAPVHDELTSSPSLPSLPEGLEGMLSNPHLMMAAQEMMSDPEKMRTMLQNPMLLSLMKGSGIMG